MLVHKKPFSAQPAINQEAEIKPGLADVCFY